VEQSLNILARQLLFIYLASESPANLSLRDKADLYLEILGNTHVRPKTSEYIKTTAKKLINLVFFMLNSASHMHR
jgi:dynein assembly factor 3